MFKLIVTRNFRQCDVDPRYYIFHDSQDDLKSVHSSDEVDNKSDQSTHSKPKDGGSAYKKNLYGTVDAMRGDEFEGKDALHTLSYDACKKLILRADLVLRGFDGQEVIRQPVEKISDLFSTETEFFPQTLEVINDLKTKAKLILEQRGMSLRKHAPRADSDNDMALLMNFGAFQKEKHADSEDPLKNMALSEDEKMEKYRQIYRVLDEFVHGENPRQRVGKLSLLNEDKVVKVQDCSQSSIDIQFSVFVPPYKIGVIDEKSVDLLCYNKDNILVNDDDFEDLIRICNLFNFFGLT